jgi:hypothetical protein
MKLRNLYLADTIVSFLFAVALLLGPAYILKFFGLSSEGKTDQYLAQLIGGALLGFGLLSWFAKDFDAMSGRGAVISLLAFSVIGFVLTLIAILSKVTTQGSAWIIAVLFLAFAAGFAYFQFMGPRE